MKLETLELTDRLRNAMADAMRTTEIYERIEQGPWKWTDGAAAHFPRLSKELSQPMHQEAHRALMKLLYDERPPELAGEIERLNQALLSMSTGYGAPAFRVTNLPEGVAGTMVTFGLLSVAGNLKDNGDLDQIKRHQGADLSKHLEQGLHRDMEGALISALKGFCIGEKPSTTVVHHVRDIVEETARHYRERMQLSAYDTLDESEKEKARGEVEELLSRPAYNTNPGRRYSHPYPILQLDPEGRTRGDTWRLRPGFGGDPNGEGAARIGEKWRAGIPEENIEEREVAMALARALHSLKEKDAIIIGPTDAVFYNNDFVFHSAGTIVDQNVQPGVGVRELFSMEAHPTEKHHKPETYSIVRSECKDLQGYTILAEPIQTGMAR